MMVKEKATDKSAQEQLEEMEKIVEEKERMENERVSKEADKQFREEEMKTKGKRIEDDDGSEEENAFDHWTPKTSLGRDVKHKKITTVDALFEDGRPILEPEIVDMLLPHLTSDFLFVGQAKGKFGGGKRRAFRQTQKKTKEGNVLTFGVMAVVGDGNGHIGIGYGRAAETVPAKEKAIRKAKLQLRRVRRGCGSFDDVSDDPHSIPLVTQGKCSSVTVRLIPAPHGTGLVCGDEMKKIFRAAGIENIYSQCFGEVKTTFNTAKACIAALDKLWEAQL